jgi:hypothetical protein
MAELLGCRKCGASWSAPNNPNPGLLKYSWCNDCGGQSFIPIGEVYGVSRPPVHVGTSPPGPTHRTPLLLLTDGSEQSSGALKVTAPAAAPAAKPPAPATVAKPPVAAVNVLPSSSKPIVLGASEQLLKDKFLNHVEGQVLSYPSASLLEKYFPRSSDGFDVKKGEMKDDSKTYARLLAIYLVEQHSGSLKISIANPKGSSYAGVNSLRRDLRPTLLRIAKGEAIAKSLNNAAYNNDGCQTSNNVKYDRYGKAYKGSRPNSQHLPAPSTSAKYWEYYVDRDGAQGASGLSIGAGKPGVERLFLGPPDYVYYTWNHYGSDVKFGAERSGLTDGDIWAVYSIAQRTWKLGLTR